MISSATCEVVGTLRLWGRRHALGTQHAHHLDLATGSGGHLAWPGTSLCCAPCCSCCELDTSAANIWVAWTAAGSLGLALALVASTRVIRHTLHPPPVRHSERGRSSHCAVRCCCGRIWPAIKSRAAPPPPLPPRARACTAGGDGKLSTAGARHQLQQQQTHTLWHAQQPQQGAADGAGADTRNAWARRPSASDVTPPPHTHSPACASGRVYRKVPTRSATPAQCGVWGVGGGGGVRSVDLARAQRPSYGRGVGGRQAGRAPSQRRRG